MTAILLFQETSRLCWQPPFPEAGLDCKIDFPAVMLLLNYFLTCETRSQSGSGVIQRSSDDGVEKITPGLEWK